MTVTVELSSTATGIVLPESRWVTILTGATDSTLPGSGVLGLITATLSPTPGVTFLVRIKSRGLLTYSNQRSVVNSPTTVRMGPFDVAAGQDVIEVQALLFSGQGGFSIIDAGGLQGTFTGDDAPEPGTETGITSQPTNKTINAGDTAVFTVTAVGTNLTYLGERSIDGGSNWTTIGTSNQITVNTTDQTENGYQYRFTVSGDNDPGNNPVVSSVATLTVNAPVGAVVTAEPNDVAVAEGADALFTSSGSNIDSWNVWRRTTGTGNGTDIGDGGPTTDMDYNHTSAQLGEDGWEYRFGLIGPDAVEVFTRWALLTVTAPVADGALASDEQGTYS